MKALEELTQDIREKLPRLTTVQEYTMNDGSKMKFGENYPVLLNDVLEWFKYSDMKDGINMMYEWIWVDTVKEILKLWDLSKPCLKDQSPELINYLHSLIKTKQ